VALATQDDVRASLRRDLTESETDWLDGLLEEASDLVVGYLYPNQVPVPTPDAISRVVASMVATVLNRPANILPDTQSLTADSYGIQFTPGTTSPGPYLSAAFKERLDPYKTGFVSVSLSSERF
jgi:hypothetical protein